MHGFIVADDVSSVMLISGAQDGDFELWHSLRQKQLRGKVRQGGPPELRDPANRQASAGGPQQHAADQEHGGDNAASSGPPSPAREHAGPPAGYRHWRSALMHSSSLELPLAAPPRHRIAAILQRPWSHVSVSLGRQSLNEAFCMPVAEGWRGLMDAPEACMFLLISHSLFAKASCAPHCY